MCTQEVGLALAGGRTPFALERFELKCAVTVAYFSEDKLLFESLRTVRDNLFNIPARLSAELVGADEARIYDRLDTEIRLACESSYWRIRHDEEKEKTEEA